MGKLAIFTMDTHQKKLLFPSNVVDKLVKLRVLKKLGGRGVRYFQDYPRTLVQDVQNRF